MYVSYFNQTWRRQYPLFFRCTLRRWRYRSIPGSRGTTRSSPITPTFPNRLTVQVWSIHYDMWLTCQEDSSSVSVIVAICIINFCGYGDPVLIFHQSTYLCQWIMSTKRKCVFGFIWGLPESCRSSTLFSQEVVRSMHVRLWLCFVNRWLPSFVHKQVALYDLKQ